MNVTYSYIILKISLGTWIVLSTQLKLAIPTNVYWILDKINQRNVSRKRLKSKIVKLFEIF